MAKTHSAWPIGAPAAFAADVGLHWIGRPATARSHPSTQAAKPSWPAGTALPDGAIAAGTA